MKQRESSRAQNIIQRGTSIHTGVVKQKTDGFNLWDVNFKGNPGENSTYLSGVPTTPSMPYCAEGQAVRVDYAGDSQQPVISGFSLSVPGEGTEEIDTKGYWYCKSRDFGGNRYSVEGPYPEGTTPSGTFVKINCKMRDPDTNEWKDFSDYVLWVTIYGILYKYPNFYVYANVYDIVEAKSETRIYVFQESLTTSGSTTTIDWQMQHQLLPYLRDSEEEGGQGFTGFYDEGKSFLISDYDYMYVMAYTQTDTLISYYMLKIDLNTNKLFDYILLYAYTVGTTTYPLPIICGLTYNLVQVGDYMFVPIRFTDKSPGYTEDYNVWYEYTYQYCVRRYCLHENPTDLGDDETEVVPGTLYSKMELEEDTVVFPDNNMFILSSNPYPWAASSYGGRPIYAMSSGSSLNIIAGDNTLIVAQQGYVNWPRRFTYGSSSDIGWGVTAYDCVYGHRQLETYDGAGLNGYGYTRDGLAHTVSMTSELTSDRTFGTSLYRSGSSTNTAMTILKSYNAFTMELTYNSIAPRSVSLLGLGGQRLEYPNVGAAATLRPPYFLVYDYEIYYQPKSISMYPLALEGDTLYANKVMHTYVCCEGSLGGIAVQQGYGQDGAYTGPLTLLQRMTVSSSIVAIDMLTGLEKWSLCLDDKVNGYYQNTLVSGGSASSYTKVRNGNTGLYSWQDRNFTFGFNMDYTMNMPLIIDKTNVTSTNYTLHEAFVTDDYLVVTPERPPYTGGGTITKNVTGSSSGRYSLTTTPTDPSGRPTTYACEGSASYTYVKNPYGYVESQADEFYFMVIDKATGQLVNKIYTGGMIRNDAAAPTLQYNYKAFNPHCFVGWGNYITFGITLPIDPSDLTKEKTYVKCFDLVTGKNYYSSLLPADLNSKQDLDFMLSVNGRVYFHGLTSGSANRLYALL